MRRSTKAVGGGGAVAIAAGAIWMWANMGGDGGLGEGVGIPGGEPMEVATEEELRDERYMATARPETQLVAADASEDVLPGDEGDNVVHVLIDDRDYLLLSGDSEPTPATLEQIQAAAKAAAGNDDGIRVRISYTRTARASVESQLEESLSDVGIDDQAIYRSSGFHGED